MILRLVSTVILDYGKTEGCEHSQRLHYAALREDYFYHFSSSTSLSFFLELLTCQSLFNSVKAL